MANATTLDVILSSGAPLSPNQFLTVVAEILILVTAATKNTNLTVTNQQLEKHSTSQFCSHGNQIEHAHSGYPCIGGNHGVSRDRA